MSEVEVDWPVPCTVWVKQPEGKWIGCKAIKDGEMSRTGVELLQKYADEASALELVRSEVIESVKHPAPVKGEEFTGECRSSLMKMQAREVGEYCYVFDTERGEWMCGVEAKQPLKLLIEFISR